MDPNPNLPRLDPAPAGEDALQRLFGGATLAEINQVPQEQLEAVYTVGCERVDREDFEGALDPMLYVVVHNPYEFRYQFAYGLCLHQLGQVADAAKHYGLAWMLDPSDAGTAFRLGECHAALGDQEAAAEAFETAKALCDPPTFQSNIRLAAEAALHRLHA
jgi:Flp pilus assembly protein TadD